MVVDLWAEWCGPCKTLGPILEKVIDETGGKVVLAKVDVDTNRQTAAAFQVQGIPAVYALKDGKVVDGFVGAQPEANVREFVAGLLPTEEEDARRRAPRGRRRGVAAPGARRSSPGTSEAVVALAELLVGAARRATRPRRSRCSSASPSRPRRGASPRWPGSASTPATTSPTSSTALLARVKDDDDARQRFVDLLEVMGPDDPRTRRLPQAAHRPAVLMLTRAHRAARRRGARDLAVGGRRAPTRSRSAGSCSCASARSARRGCSATSSCTSAVAAPRRRRLRRPLPRRLPAAGGCGGTPTGRPTAASRSRSRRSGRPARAAELVEPVPGRARRLTTLIGPSFPRPAPLLPRRAPGGTVPDTPIARRRRRRSPALLRPRPPRTWRERLEHLADATGSTPGADRRSVPWWPSAAVGRGVLAAAAARRTRRRRRCPSRAPPSPSSADDARRRSRSSSWSTWPGAVAAPGPARAATGQPGGRRHRRRRRAHRRGRRGPHQPRRAGGRRRARLRPRRRRAGAAGRRGLAHRPAGSRAPTGPVNLNTADAEALDSLPGSVRRRPRRSSSTAARSAPSPRWTSCSTCPASATPSSRRCATSSRCDRRRPLPSCWRPPPRSGALLPARGLVVRRGRARRASRRLVRWPAVRWLAVALLASGLAQRSLDGLDGVDPGWWPAR